MELQIDTKDLTAMLEAIRGNTILDKDYLLIASLVGIMERLERLQGAILSLQRTT